MSAPVHYRLSTPHPERHLFDVCLSLDSTHDTLTFSLPDWVPGSYMIRDYARHIVHIEATVDGHPATLRKCSKSRWQLSPAKGAVSVHYAVYALDPSVRGAYLDTRGWFCQGVCVFLRCHEAAAAEHRVSVAAEALRPGWSLETSLPVASADGAPDRAFRADAYASLIDHPLMAGEVRQVDFDVFGVPHSLVIAGRCDCDPARLAADLAAICETHVRCFGEPPPMPHYRFLVRLGGDRLGGLEHRDCTVLAVPRRHLVRGAARSDYADFLSLASHEYFHAWLVKRIRPAALAGAPLDREAYTRTLWVFEGITSYYDELALLRAGLIGPAEYLSRLATTVSRVQRGVGRLRQSLSDASFDAWTRFYKQDENAANAIVSYYAKGALVALALDLSLRQRSDGALSLDAVMRAFWQRHQLGETVAEDGFETLVSELVNEDMGAFFDQAVRGCDDVPLDIYLAAQGVSMKWQPAERAPAWLGCTFRPGTTDVAVVHEDSPAQRGGLTPGDELVAWQGVRFRAEDETALRCTATVGEAVDLDVFRGDELIRLSVQPAAPARSVCVLESKPGFEACRDQWLYGRV